MPDPTCQDFDSFIGTIDACWPKGRGQIIAVLKQIFNYLNCENTGCNPGACIQDVGEGITPDRFILVGWGGKIPDPITCPILWAITGCDVYIGVNKPGCDLVGGTGWCRVCGNTAGEIFTAQLRTNVGTVLSTTNGTVNRKIDISEWDDGVGVVLLNSAPNGGYLGDNSFQLVAPGTYLIESQLAALITQSDSPTNMKVPAWIQDITTPGMLKDFGAPEFSGNAPSKAPVNHFGRIKVQVITPRTFAIQYNGNPGVGITSHICSGDEIRIQKIG